MKSWARKTLFFLLCGVWMVSPRPVCAKATAPCSEKELQHRRELVASGQVVVSVSVVDLFLGPTEKGPVEDQARLGELLRVLPETLACGDPQHPMLFVETRDGDRGWVWENATLVWPKQKPPYARPDGGKRSEKADAKILRVVSRLANVYAEPDVTLARPKVVLTVHTKVVLSETASDRWYKIVLPDGSLGFVQRGDVESLPPKAEPTVECVLKEASQYEGAPYLWGGRSPLGIDCSGLVKNAFDACGASTPRNAGPQWTWSLLQPVVAQPQLRRGDLLFFRGASPKPDQQDMVKHVGLYVGEGRFLHATTSETPTVHVSLLSAPEWQRRYLGARRYRGF